MTVSVTAPKGQDCLWSLQQERIFSWFAQDTDSLFDIDVHGHLIARARAGTGKTTTIIEGVKRAPERSILICAFSKIIQEELLKRIGTQYPHIEARTLHSVGLSCVKAYREKIGVSYTGERADSLTDKVCERHAPDPIKRLVSKLHTKGREIAPHATKLGDLTAIAITFECEPDESWSACQSCGKDRAWHDEVARRFAVDRIDPLNHAYVGFDATYVEQKALAAMELASNVQSGETIDGSDMIFLPVRNHWLRGKYNLVVVDEAQDMTTAQLEIAQGVLRPGGRIAIVGDDRQAIFGFRGADSGSLDRLKRELHAAELGLTTTYRCAQRIVTLAQETVPDFEAGPENPEGEVLTIHVSKLVETAGPGDFILSRVNAPLVSTAMQLLRAGKRARVAGRDIGAGLRALIRRLNARTIPELLRKIEAWAAKDIARHEAMLSGASNGRKHAIQAKIEAVRDQADMLISLADGARNVEEVSVRIDALFTDDGLGVAGVITCSSVHRAKGLEANRVFILRDTLRVNTVEEQNIGYVAVTRAKQTLVWVVE